MASLTERHARWPNCFMTLDRLYIMEMTKASVMLSYLILSGLRAQ